MTTKHYPPDPVSAIYWTKNRDRDRWKDVKDINVEKSARGMLNKAVEELISEGRKQYGPEFILQVKSLIEAHKEAEQN